MSSNQILQKVLLKEAAVVSGKLVKVSGATHTQLWTRPTVAIQAIEPEFTKAIEKHTEPLPEGTAELAVREGEHSSKDDVRKHFSIVCYDANGNSLGTRHVTKA